MGFFRSLKKKISESILPATRTGDVVNRDEDNAKDIDRSAVILKPDIVPPEVLGLLWFLDGPLKNYKNTATHRSRVSVEGFVLELSLMGADEPSAIGLSQPVKKPANIESVERPQYYPSYGSLSPEQRWVYLNWLRNVDAEINIGYVFVFYYGLERHLFFGDAEAAFNMILRLRQKHRNNSFMGYSSNALVAACIFHKKPDWFVKYMQSISDVEEVVVDAVYVLAKQALGMGLTARELMKAAGKVGFTNRRYIGSESIIFEQELNKLLLERHSTEEISLSHFELDKSPTVQQMILANYSMDSEQRVISIPSIIDNQAFSDMAIDLLKTTHERVKILLRELRKSGNYTPQEHQVVNKPTREVDEAFRGCPLFAEIDIHQLDENIGYFDNAICPYCSEQLEKRPAQKAKCPHCGNPILVRNSVFTGQKLMLTEDKYRRMVDIRNERIYRNWVKTMLAREGIDLLDFTKIIKRKELSIEEALVEVISGNAQKHYRDSNMGLYRNSLLNLGNVYERMKQLETALEKYLLVCYYDLRGCINNSREYKKELAFLAPAVVSWIAKLGDELGLSGEQMQEKFLAIVGQLPEREKASVINSTWGELGAAIYRKD